MASLELPQLRPNETGWGPTDLPPDLVNVPFAPFTKNDKLGRASDWASSNFPRMQGRGNQPSNVFNFSMDNEDSNFHLVDSRPTRTKHYGHRRYQQYKRGGDKDDYRTLDTKKDQHRNRQQQQQQKRPFYWREQRNTPTYTPSVEIKPEWTVLEQLQIPALAKLTLQVEGPTDAVECGRLRHYDRLTDRVTPKASLPLAKTRAAFHAVTASDDPVLRRLAGDGTARIFITDSALTAIMCAPRSVYSWDIVISRRGDQLWFDKRPDSVLDKETVNETAPEGIAEDDTINGVAALAIEATAVRQNFSQQCLDHSQAVDFGGPDPFVSEGADKEASAPVGYRYRTWNLGDGLTIAVRTEVDGIITRQGTDQLLTIRTFNQAGGSGTDGDWRRKLERQTAAVLAMEVKNNSARVARWTLSAMLAGCDVLKVGFVTRVSPKDPHSHVLLTTQVQKPRDLLTQLNVNLANGWAIVRNIVDQCLSFGKERYVLMKDPNKSLLYLYEVPPTAFMSRYEEERSSEVSASQS